MSLNKFFLIERGDHFYCVPRKDLLTIDATILEDGETLGFKYGRATYQGTVIARSAKEKEILDKIQSLKKKRKKLEASFHADRPRKAAQNQRKLMEDMKAKDKPKPKFSEVRKERRGLEQKRRAAELASSEIISTPNVDSKSVEGTEEEPGSKGKNVYSGDSESNQSSCSSGSDSNSSIASGNTVNLQKAKGKSQDVKILQKLLDESTAGTSESDADPTKQYERSPHEPSLLRQNSTLSTTLNAGTSESNAIATKPSERSPREPSLLHKNSTLSTTLNAGTSESNAIATKPSEWSPLEPSLLRQNSTFSATLITGTSESDAIATKQTDQSPREPSLLHKNSTFSATLNIIQPNSASSVSTFGSQVAQKEDALTLSDSSECAKHTSRKKKKTHRSKKRRKYESSSMDSSSDSSSTSSESEDSSDPVMDDSKLKRHKKRTHKKKKKRTQVKRNAEVYPGQNFLWSANDEGVVKLADGFEVYVQEKHLREGELAKSITQFIRIMVPKVFTPLALANATPQGFPPRGKGKRYYKSVVVPPRLHPDGMNAILAKAKALEASNKAWRPKQSDQYMRSVFSTRCCEFR